jgi:hypothetical protein
MGQGRIAARSIDAYVRGEPLPQETLPQEK